MLGVAGSTALPVVPEAFHVTSYQANFASHLTRDRHVGFLNTQSGIGETTKGPVYLVHTSIPNYN